MSVFRFYFQSSVFFSSDGVQARSGMSRAIATLAGATFATSLHTALPVGTKDDGALGRTTRFATHAKTFKLVKLLLNKGQHVQTGQVASFQQDARGTKLEES